MENKCKIIEDLLPLYVEEMVSVESKKFIEENIEDCPGCLKTLGELKSDIKIEDNLDTKPLEFLDKEIKKDKRLNNFAIGLFIISLTIILISYLTSPIYFPYSEDLLEVSSYEDKYTVEFSKDVTGYSATNYKMPEEFDGIVYIEAWKTPLDKIIPNRGPLFAEIQKPAKLLYSQNNGEVDIKLKVGRGGTHSNGMLLPRLAQNIYLRVAFIVFGISIIIAFIGKFSKFAKYAIIGFPLSYIISHFSIFIFRNGWHTYNLVRDFIFILILSIVIYLLILTIGKIRQRNY